MNAAINPSSPLTGNPIVLQRLATFYIGVFWIVAGMFYLSLIQASTDISLGMLCFATAGIACLLLIMKRKADAALSTVVAEEDWQATDAGRALLAEAKLLIHLHDLFNGQDEATQVGLTLVSLRGPADANASDLVRRALFRETESRIFEMDSRTFAFAERRPDAAQILESLADKLEAEMARLAVYAPGLEECGVTVGTTIASSPECTTTDLLVNARASRKFAEAHGRDRFVCHV
jgi:hypothetical protein